MCLEVQERLGNVWDQHVESLQSACFFTAAFVRTSRQLPDQAETNPSGRFKKCTQHFSFGTGIASAMTQGIWQSSFCQVQTRDSEIHLFGWAV